MKTRRNYAAFGPLVPLMAQWSVYDLPHPSAAPLVLSWVMPYGIYPACAKLQPKGGTDDLVFEHGVLDRDMVLLEKPFTLHARLSKVYKSLHVARSAQPAETT